MIRFNNACGLLSISFVFSFYGDDDDEDDDDHDGVRLGFYYRYLRLSSNNKNGSDVTHLMVSVVLSLILCAFPFYGNDEEDK